MRFTTRHDLELPAATVFAGLTDFAVFERVALRRGAEVTQLAGGSPAGVGRSYRILFRFRGRPRELITEIVQVDAPNVVSSVGRFGGYVGTLTFELSPLQPGRTRLRADMEVKARTLTARVMLQSLRLAKGSLMERYRARIQTLCRQIEQRAERGEI